MKLGWRVILLHPRLHHPNPTIWHNQIDVCVFVGVHYHYANVALKIIRGTVNESRCKGCGLASYVEIYTLCTTNIKFSSSETINVAKKAEKDYYSFDKYLSKEAKDYLKMENTPINT